MTKELLELVQRDQVCRVVEVDMAAFGTTQTSFGFGWVLVAVKWVMVFG